MIKPIDDFFVTESVSPERMDQLWAEGWRHFGPCFFRYSLLALEDRVRRVQPLRVDLSTFNYSKSDRRVLRKNADLALQVKPTLLDDERRSLFAAHRCRFQESVPDALEVF